MRTLALCLSSLLFVLLAAPREAGATPPFPPAVKAFLQLDYTPQCALCHTDGDKGGLGTVNTPFGKSVRAWGTVAWNVPSLEKALAGMEAAGTDSVGDCIPDITKLKAGGNPDVDDGGCRCAPVATAPAGMVPSYGCYNRISPVAGAGLSVWSALTLVALVVLRRRRPRA